MEQDFIPFWTRPGFDPRTAEELQQEHDTGIGFGITGLICVKCGAISDERGRGDPDCRHSWEIAHLDDPGPVGTKGPAGSMTKDE